MASTCNFLLGEEVFDLALVVVALVELHEYPAQQNDILVSTRVQRLDVVVVRLMEQQVDGLPVLHLHQTYRKVF